MCLQQVTPVPIYTALEEYEAFINFKQMVPESSPPVGAWGMLWEEKINHYYYAAPSPESPSHSVQCSINNVGVQE